MIRILLVKFEVFANASLNPIWSNADSSVTNGLTSTFFPFPGLLGASSYLYIIETMPFPARLVW